MFRCVIIYHDNVKMSPKPVAGETNWMLWSETKRNHAFIMQCMWLWVFFFSKGWTIDENPPISGKWFTAKMHNSKTKTRYYHSLSGLIYCSVKHFHTNFPWNPFLCIAMHSSLTVLYASPGNHHFLGQWLDRKPTVDSLWLASGHRGSFSPSRSFVYCLSSTEKCRVGAFIIVPYLTCLMVLVLEHPSECIKGEMHILFFLFFFLHSPLLVVYCHWGGVGAGALVSTWVLCNVI